MLLQPDQQQWLAEFGVKRKAQTKLQAREDQKAALITKLMRDLQDQQEDLLTGTQQTVIKKGTKKDTQQTQDYIKRKQHKLFDVADQKKGYVLATAIDDKAKKPKFKEEEWNKLTGEQKHFQELQQAGRIVDTLARQMQTEVVKLDENGRPKTKVLVNSKTGKAKKDKNGKKKTKHVKGPLFTAEEIKEELYTPMVRAGLIPETNVPDEFSATKKMLDGSFKAYGKRLSREKKRGMFAENYKLGFAVGKGLVSFASAVQTLDLDSKLPDSQLQSSGSEIGNIQQGFGLAANDPGAVNAYADAAEKTAQAFEFVQNVSDIAFDVAGDVAGEVVDGSDEAKHEGNPIKKAAGKVAGLAIADIATALGGALNQYALGMAASSAFSAIVKGPDVAKKLAEQDVAGAGVVLSTAIKDTLIKLGPPNDPDIASAADKAAKAFTAALKADAVIKELKAHAFEKAAAELGAAAGPAAQLIKSDIGVMKVFNKQANVDLAEGSAGEVVAAEFERDETPKPTTDQIRDHKPVDEHKAQWVLDGKEFICLKCPGKGEDPEFFAGMLEAKIKRLEQDAAIWKWITMLGGMGFDLAADFVAPLAIGGALLRLAKNANEALKRYTDMVAFLGDRQHMLNAASEFSTAVTQFIRNADQQFMHYSINAAIEGLKVVAAALQCGGITAGAGAGLAGAANISQGIEGVIYEAAKRWDLGKAWDTYKIALENPDNRKDGLIAIKKNPTLAKYAIAWGAVIKKDPLVTDFMHSCGLNKEATLKDPDANTDLVVTYLEKRMPDDNVVVGRDYTAIGKVELTATVWIKEKTKGEKKLGAKAQDTRVLDSLLARWEIEYPLLKDAEPEISNAPDDDKKKEAVARWTAVVNEHETMLKEMSNAFALYKPYNEEGEPVLEMSDVRDKFTKRIAAHQAELNHKKSKLRKMLPQAKKAAATK
jgi:hypothetical protein